MKAVIMAGGEGTRLKPLTCDIPKPMARLCGRPIMEYILDLLEENEVTQASVTTRYLPHLIREHFPEGRYKNIALTFVEEDKPLGTAGSVKNAAKNFEDPFLVISGDAMCDFQLQKALAFHKQRGADATLIVKRVEDPREYGLVQVEKNRVVGFVEKPCYAQAVCDTANTGIYIINPQSLNLIPDDKAFDFAKDLFPRMMEQGLHLAAYEETGYWCDIGDLETLRRCMGDMLEGKVRCDIHGRYLDGVLYKGEPPKGNYTIAAPAYVGEDVRIGEGSFIEAYSVIDDHVTIEERCKIKASIIYPLARIASGAHLTGTIVGGSAFIGSDAHLYEGSTIGSGAIIGSRSAINPSVKVWNKKYVEEEMVLHDNLQMGNGKRSYFGEEGLFGYTNIEITPESCARIGSAIGSVKKSGRVGLSYGSNHSEAVLASAIAAGILSAGCDVWNFGQSFEAEIGYLTNQCNLDFAVHICGGKESIIKIILRGGLSPSRSMERDIEHNLLRGEFLRADHNHFGTEINMTNLKQLYTGQCIEAAGQRLKGLIVAVSSENRVVQDRFCHIAKKLGAEISPDAPITVDLSASGKSCSVAHSQLGKLDRHGVLALAVWDLFQKGEDVAVPFDTPGLIDQVAQVKGGSVYRYMHCPSGNEDQMARKIYQKHSWLGDGIICGIKALRAFLTTPERVAQIMRMAKDMAVVGRTIPITEAPGYVMGRIHAMTKDQGPIGEGIIVQYESGTILARPLKTGDQIRIIAQAHSMEAADELCGSFIQEVFPDRLDSYKSNDPHTQPET